MSKVTPNTLAFFTIDQLDPLWCREQAKKMMDFHPCSERANASGKFYKIYQCWHFHKDSQWPLIQAFNDAVKQQVSNFEVRMEKALNYEFVVLSLVEEFNRPVCNLHKDGHFFDGQLHLTIQGNARIEVLTNNDQAQRLVFPDGQIWYLNGSHFPHKVLPVQSTRIELCAPVNQTYRDIQIKHKAVCNDRYRWVDGSHPEWIALRKKQAQYVKDAVSRKTASNLNIADFSIYPGELK